MGTKLRNIAAEVSKLDDKEVEGFTRQLEAMGYEFSELKEKIEGHPKYKKFLEKYVSDALDNYFPHNYNPEVEEIAKARIDILSEVRDARDGILKEFLWEHCKEIVITFRV